MGKNATLPPSMKLASQPTTEFFQKCWRSCASLARTPVTGTLVPNEVIVSTIEPVFSEQLDQYTEETSEAEFVATLHSKVSEAIKIRITKDRESSGDLELYRDPEDKRYDQNLNIQALQSEESANTSYSSEWSKLEQFLRPFSFHTLSKKGVSNQDAEDIYYETLAELARPRKSSGEVPIRTIKIFEEVIPFFCKMIQFRCIDWQRKQSSLKNQPNTQESIEGLMEHPGFKEKTFQSSDTKTIRFEDIYSQCKESLTSFQWQLLYKIYISAEANIKDLIADPQVLEQAGLEPKTSDSTKRRRLNEILDDAKRKLAEIL